MRERISVVHLIQSPKMSRAGQCKNVDRFGLDPVLLFGPDLELLLRRSSYVKGRAN